MGPRTGPRMVSSRTPAPTWTSTASVFSAFDIKRVNESKILFIYSFFLGGGSILIILN